MTNMHRSEKGFFKGFLIAMFSTLFWIGVIVFVAVSLNGCSGQTAEPDPCADFNSCVAEPTALVTCINDTCACITSHPGENRAVTCDVGMPAASKVSQ